MSMEIVGRTPRRSAQSGNKASMALFCCSHCNQIMERTLQSKHNESCGCTKSYTGKDSASWKGGRSIDKDGYVLIHCPGHQRANTVGYVKEHILIAGEVFGKPLPKDVVIHHVDGNPVNNANNNLVICGNDEYHQLIHMRTRAFKATGNPNLLWCSGCKQFLNHDLFSIKRNGKNRVKNGYCSLCLKESHRINIRNNPDTQKNYREKNKEALKIFHAKYHEILKMKETPEELRIRRDKNKLATKKYRLKKKEADNA